MRSKAPLESCFYSFEWLVCMAYQLRGTEGQGFNPAVEATSNRSKTISK
jgi:hypothetical protein